MTLDISTRRLDAPQDLGDAFAAHLLRHRDEPWQELPTGQAAYDEAMQPVDQAVVLGFESALLGAAISAETVAAQVERHPEKLIGFAGIDPTQPAALAKLERAVELGLLGITISPSGQGFHPCHSDAMVLLDACTKRGLPVFIEPLGALAGPAVMEFDRPSLLDEIARSFPELKIVLGSLADPFLDEALALIAKHPHVYADLSGLIRRPWSLYHALTKARERGVFDQLLFGSGFPFCTPEQAIVTLYSVNTMTQTTPLPSIPREMLRSIVERDTLTTLGLPRREAKRITAPANAERAVTVTEETVG